MKIALINPNSDSAVTDVMVKLARRYAPDMSIAGWTASRGPSLIASEAALLASAEEVLRMAEELLAADEQVDGIVIGAIGDPGIAAVRNLTQIHVCGLGESALREAARHGKPFAIVTTTPDLAGSLEKMVNLHKLGDVFTGFAFTEGGLPSLARDENRMLNALATACNEAQRGGAETIIIGGGPLSQAAERLEGRLSIPVISPLRAAITELSAARPAPSAAHSPR